MGSHFTGQVVQELCRRLDIQQHLVIAYAPWINGTVERANRDILQVMRVMLLEFQLDLREWVYLLPLVQSNVNHTPVESLAHRAPVELFTGLPSANALSTLVLSNGNIQDGANVYQRPDIVRALESLRESLHQVHRAVAKHKDTVRQRQQARHRSHPINFSVGDFVLWSRIDERLSSDKLLARWIGPFVGKETLPHAFRIQHLVTKKLFVVHGSRLRLYCDGSLDTTQELLAHVANQGMVLEVQDIISHRHVHGVWSLLVAWVGLQEAKNSWEPLSSLHQDVPAKVRAYVMAAKDPALTAALEAS